MKPTKPYTDKNYSVHYFIMPKHIISWVLIMYSSNHESKTLYFVSLMKGYTFYCALLVSQIPMWLFNTTWQNESWFKIVYLFTYSPLVHLFNLLVLYISELLLRSLKYLKRIPIGENIFWFIHYTTHFIHISIFFLVALSHSK